MGVTIVAVGVSEMDILEFKRTHTVTPKLGLLLLHSFCLGGPIFSLYALYVLLLISFAVLNLIPIMGAKKIYFYFSY